MVSYVTRIPAGFPGMVSRDDSLTIEPNLIDATTPPTTYGGVVKLVSGKLQPIASSDAATVIYGFLAKAFPTQSTTNALGAAVPPTSGLIDVLRRGYMTVTLARGTAVKGAAAYVRITADTGKLVGDIETAADSSKCVAIPNAVFTGAADAGGIVEISYNI